MASMSSMRSRRYEKSGSTRSIPRISPVGNISPVRTTTIRPSCSTTVMFFPISPRPPRGRILSGLLIAGQRRGTRLGAARRGALGRAAGDEESMPLERGPDRVPLSLAGGHHRQAQAPLDDSEHLERRLDRGGIGGDGQRLVDRLEGGVQLVGA